MDYFQFNLIQIIKVFVLLLILLAAIFDCNCKKQSDSTLTGQNATKLNLTVCEHIIKDNLRIQGVVFPVLHSGFQSTSGLLFVQNFVFEFDLNPHVPLMYLKRAGCYLYQYFPNLNLFDDIHSVFGLHAKDESDTSERNTGDSEESNKNSTKIYFILTNNNDDVVYGHYFNNSKKSSVVYDLDRHQLTDLNAKLDPNWFPMVPRYHPFVYFSDNQDIILTHQLPFCFKSNLALPLSIRLNRLHWIPLNSKTKPASRTPIREKLIGAFIFQDHFYLVASKHLFLVSGNQMVNSLFPRYRKVAIENFLICTKDAVLPDPALQCPLYSELIENQTRYKPIDWISIFRYISILIVIVVVLILLAVFWMTIKSFISLHRSQQRFQQQRQEEAEQEESEVSRSLLSKKINKVQNNNFKVIK